MYRGPVKRDPVSSRPADAAATVLLLSFGQRDALAAQIDRLGWHVTASRRLEGIAERKRTSGAVLTLVDFRDDPVQALSALSALAGPILAIYSADQGEQLAQFAAAGVSHFLREPFVDAELATLLDIAAGALPVGAANKAGPARDALTGLAPAQTFRHWVSAQLPQQAVSLILVNIARFDTINASLGRETGDMALRALAHRIEPLVRDVDAAECLLARMPGAEFAIGISGPVTPERLHLLAEAIVDVVSRPLATSEGQVSLGCRVAIVAQRAGDRTPNMLIKRASQALSEIRDGEAGAIALMLGDAADANELSRSLHADLRSALTNAEIDILFQPQVGVLTGHIEGVEALARWRHPRHGVIGAVTLFAVADQSNYSVELSAHIQKQALKAAAAWPPSLSHLRLSLNVTAADLARPRFAETFQALIDESGFPRGRLTVEITESSVMADIDSAAQVLAQFRASGCRVAIDDFGTGYSSLAWLKSLPADYLKLDKALAGDILGGDRDAVVIRAVVGMARSLGLSVIAEGVETEGQLALLAREGCTLYQGFLCAPPLSVDALVKIVG
jgi:diguanylate cyclase (GGDEF)-like protein